jgi:hypothetical protein
MPKIDIKLKQVKFEPWKKKTLISRRIHVGSINVKDLLLSQVVPLLINLLS